MPALAIVVADGAFCVCYHSRGHLPRSRGHTAKFKRTFASSTTTNNAARSLLNRAVFSRLLTAQETLFALPLLALHCPECCFAH